MGSICIKVNVKQLGPEEVPDDSEATIWLQSKCPRSAAEWNLGCTPYETLTSKWHCHDLKSKTPDGQTFHISLKTFHIVNPKFIKHKSQNITLNN